MDERRTLTSELASGLRGHYEVYARVLASVLRPYAELKAKPGAERETMAKVREVVRRLNVLATQWALTASKRMYNSKREEVSKAAENGGNLKTGAPVKGNGREMASRVALQLVSANSTIEATVHRFLSAYGQAFGAVNTARANEQAQFMSAADESAIRTKVEWYVARDYDAGTISRRLREFLSKLVDGKDFIEINGRNYNIASFAEMTARSEMHNIAVEATIDECKQWDNDLVQFSRHDSPCDLCGPLEGKVFSISGEDEEFPPLDEPVTVEANGKTYQVDPKFSHPNCEHGLNPVTRAILAAAGESGR